MIIAKMLSDYTMKQQEERLTRERSGKFNPSKFGRCYRMQYWDRLNEPVSDPLDYRTLLVFQVGHLFHEFIQDLVLKHDASIQKEVLVKTDDVCGYADLVSDDCVVDLKTVHSFAFKYMNEPGFDVEFHKKDNVLQVMLYAILLKKQKARLVYISKDDFLINEYEIKVNDYWKNLIDTELNTLVGYWTRKELPPAQPRCYQDKSGKFRECGFCGFKTKCKETEALNGTVSISK